jgi:hypothetical protein
MIVVGGIIMFLGLLGCAAAFTENSFLLATVNISIIYQNIKQKIENLYKSSNSTELFFFYFLDCKRQQ